MKLDKSVKATGWLSLLTDISSEMIFSVLPFFIVSSLGGSAAFLGLVDGVSDAVAAFLKVFAGMWSDRARRRKPLILVGYGVSALARPMMAMATLPAHILFVRVADRVGKGFRGAPRDALIADVTPSEHLGHAYGFQRAMDNLGAAIGPLLAFAFMFFFDFGVRTVLWIAVVPGVVAWFVAYFYILEPDQVAVTNRKKFSFKSGLAELTKNRRLLLFFISFTLFSMGNASSSFLLLKAKEVGISMSMIPLIWGVHNIFRAIFSERAGRISDRVGRSRLLLAGWLYFSLIYVGLAYTTQIPHLWVMMVFYGLFFSLTEGAASAFVANESPKELKASVLGLFAFLQAIISIPASVLFGHLSTEHSMQTAFLTGAGFAFSGALLLTFVQRARK